MRDWGWGSLDWIARLSTTWGLVQSLSAIIMTMTDQEPIPAQMVLLSTLFKLTRLFLAWPNPNSTINNERQVQARSQSCISMSSIHFEWLSWHRSTTTFRNAWISIGFHGQGAARSYKTRLANLSLCQPHGQTDYQRCTGAPVAPLGCFDYQTRHSIKSQAPIPCLLFPRVNHQISDKIIWTCYKYYLTYL